MAPRTDDARRGALRVKRRRLPAGLLLICLAVGACGQEPSVPASEDEAPAADSAEWSATVDVPVIRTVGDVPPLARRIDVAADAAGALTVDGKPVDVAALRTLLRERCATEGGAEPSDVDALLILDRTLPWQAAQVVMQECASARLARIFFAVRHVDGAPGAIATFLPLDRPVARSGEIEARPKIVVRVRRGEGMSASSGLEAVVAAQASTGRDGAVVEIDAAPSTPVSLVLELVDAAATSGASDVTFVGTPVSGTGLVISELVETLRATPARYATVNGEPLSAAAGGATTSVRIVGSYAGFADHPEIGVELEEELEMVEPDER